MAAQYELHENPDPKQTGKKQLLHPRFAPLGTVNAQKLYELAADGTTFSPAELEAALNQSTRRVVTALKDGYNVELGEIGTLTISLKGRPVMDEKEIRSASIEVNNLVLRTSKRMKQQLRGIQLKRNPEAWTSSPLDVKRRDAALAAHFEKNPFISREEYQEIRGCKRSKAIEELNKMIVEGRLCRYGASRLGLYQLNKNMNNI